MNKDTKSALSYGLQLILGGVIAWGIVLLITGCGPRATPAKVVEKGGKTCVEIAELVEGDEARKAEQVCGTASEWAWVLDLLERRAAERKAKEEAAAPGPEPPPDAPAVPDKE